MTEPAAELIDPRDAGLRTLDLKQPLFDAEALARADAVLEAMSGEMFGWLEADVVRLQRLRVAAERAGWSAASLEALLAAAHNIKGAGATYGSPLATRIAASLCRLIETDAGKASARRDPALAAAHVDALRAAVRDRISLDAHPIGRALLRALEARVEALGVAPV
jgi:dienelactone hydrolase